MFVLGAEDTTVIRSGITLVATVYLLSPFSGYLSQLEIDREHTELLKELRETDSCGPYCNAVLTNERLS